MSIYGIITGMGIMLMFQFVGLMFVNFEELAIDLIVLGIKLFPISIAAAIIIIGLKLLWRNKR
jgi:NADH:ubiquinone oxidoreductase subunit K